MREELDGCSNRAVALGGLALYAPVAVVLVLTHPFPMPSPPPQLDSPGYGNLAGVAVLSSYFIIAVASGLAIRNLRLSLHRQQWIWSVTFVALGLAGLLAPVLGLLQAALSQPQWSGVTLVSAVGVLLTFVATLLFAPLYPHEA